VDLQRLLEYADQDHAPKKTFVEMFKELPAYQRRYKKSALDQSLGRIRMSLAHLRIIGDKLGGQDTQVLAELDGALMHSIEQFDYLDKAYFTDSPPGYAGVVPDHWEYRAKYR